MKYFQLILSLTLGMSLMSVTWQNQKQACSSLLRLSHVYPNYASQSIRYGKNTICNVANSGGMQFHHATMVYISSKLSKQYIASRGFYTDVLINFQPESLALSANILFNLLGLCGDIHPHPGPYMKINKKKRAKKPKFPCTCCGKEVLCSHRALSCDSCGNWTHTKCGDISEAEYTALTELDDFAWFCPACDVVNFSESFFTFDMRECSNQFEVLGDSFVGKILANESILNMSTKGTKIDTNDTHTGIKTNSGKKKKGTFKNIKQKQTTYSHTGEMDTYQNKQINSHNITNSCITHTSMHSIYTNPLTSQNNLHDNSKKIHTSVKDTGLAAHQDNYVNSKINHTGEQDNVPPVNHKAHGNNKKNHTGDKDSHQGAHGTLKILNINFQSLKGKVPELQELLEAEKPDILIGTETWLNSDVKSCEIFPANYAIFRKDRPDGCGGVLIAVKNLPSQHLEDLDVKAELIWVKIKINKDSSLFLGAYYNPDTSINSILELEISLSQLHNNYTNQGMIWLGGDFNLRDINWNNQTTNPGSNIKSQCNKFLDICTNFQLEQVVKIPTRGRNTLDLFLVTNPTLITEVDTLPGIGKSDHNIVRVYGNLKPKFTRVPKRKIYQYSRGDLSSLKTDLINFGLELIPDILNHNVQENWKKFTHKLSSLMETYIPTKQSTTRYNLPWYNARLKRMRRKLQKLYNKQRSTNKDLDKTLFKKYRTTYNKEIRHAQTDYINTNMNNNLHQNTKNFWKIVKSKQVDNNGIPPLNHNNQTTNDSQEKAEILNSYFQSVYTQEDLKNIPNMTGNQIPDIPEIEITVEGVKKLLEDMEPNKASGPDQIPARILKECANEIAPILTAIFTQSLHTGELPSDWLISHISPIFKKGNPSQPCNYRPIALTSICCKTLEHIITSHIMTHLDRHNILNDSQHGFRKRRGCDTQLIITTSDLAASLENKKQVDAVLLDFSKAFDRVPHTRLLKKLKHYGVTGRIHDWIKIFLTTRKQRVILDGKLSSTAEVTSSVPQGTVLGPLCFLIYINDMPNCVSTGTKTRLFADDAFVYREINDDSDHEAFQHDLDALSSWGSDWQMNFNTDKCYTMHFSNNKSHTITPYKLCGNVLSTTNSHSYLGITFSSDLKWSTHINNVTNSCKRVLGVIRRNFRSCSPDVKSRLYLSLVQPKMEYGSAAWFPILKQDAHKLDMVQRSAARLCLNDYSRESSVSSMILNLKWTGLETRREIIRLTMMFKISHGLVDIDWLNHLSKPQRKLKRTHDLTYQRQAAKTKIYETSFFPWTTRLWNDLPHDILDATTLSTFKTGLKNHYNIHPTTHLSAN